MAPPRQPHPHLPLGRQIGGPSPRLELPAATGNPSANRNRVEVGPRNGAVAANGRRANAGQPARNNRNNGGSNHSVRHRRGQGPAMQERQRRRYAEWALNRATQPRSAEGVRVAREVDVSAGQALRDGAEEAHNDDDDEVEDVLRSENWRETLGLEDEGAS